MGHRAGCNWTPEEDRIIEQSKRKGESCVVIARRIDRTVKAIERRWAEIRAEAGVVNLGNSRDRRATDRLAIAINRLISRMAPAEVASVMGRPSQSIPGTERPYGTCSALRRLAA